MFSQLGCRIPKIIEGFEPKNIFNADETGLFYKALPTQSLSLKRVKCAGGKLAKERLTCLLACSITGEKLLPLVIGKAKYPRAFRDAGLKPTGLLVLWRSNTKAWMTAALFSEWLELINRIMKASKRHILLFLDNATAHPNITLSNIKLVFFPPNLTAGAQPLDQGIIQAVKLGYRR